MKTKPSRTLNEVSTVAGLTGADILCIAAVFTLSQRVLFYFGLEILALVIAVIIGITLSIIRMRYRRKIIRDAIQFYISRFFFSGVLYVRQSYKANSPK